MTTCGPFLMIPYKVNLSTWEACSCSFVSFLICCGTRGLCSYLSLRDLCRLVVVVFLSLVSIRSCSVSFRVSWVVASSSFVSLNMSFTCRSLNRKYVVKCCAAHIRTLSRSFAQKVTIHYVTTMLATSKNVLFPGHNHLLTTITDDNFPFFIILAGAQAIIKVLGHQYRWSAGDYDLEIGHF